MSKVTSPETFALQLCDDLNIRNPSGYAVVMLAEKIAQRDRAMLSYRSELPTLTEEIPPDTERANPWIAGGHEAHLIRGED